LRQGGKLFHFKLIAEMRFAVFLALQLIRIKCLTINRYVIRIVAGGLSIEDQFKSTFGFVSNFIPIFFKRPRV
jgi:hypothetical protein